MANCTQCNKQFTCGCQKAYHNGVLVCRDCKTNLERTSKNVDTSRDLALELARQQIRNLRDK